MTLRRKLGPQGVNSLKRSNQLQWFSWYCKQLHTLQLLPPEQSSAWLQTQVCFRGLTSFTTSGVAPYSDTPQLCAICPWQALVSRGQSQLLLDCICFSALQLHQLQLLLPDCVLFSCCSPGKKPTPQKAISSQSQTREKKNQPSEKPIANPVQANQPNGNLAKAN